MKYALLAGATSAALSPVPGNSVSFPIYTTVETTAANDLTGNAVKSTYVTANANLIGGSRGYRNGLYVFPVQKVNKNVTNALDTSAAVANDSGYRSFWIHELAKVGAYIAPNAGTNDATYASGQYAGGESFVLCSAIDTILNCNARMFNTANSATATKLETTKDQWVQYRTVGKANTQVWTDASRNYQFQWNEDLGLAAQYQSSWTTSTAVTDGTRWCSEWKKTLAADGTAQDSEVVFGFDKMTKCNFLLTAADATIGPTFKVKSMDITTYLLQWIEFKAVADLGSNGILSTTDDAASFFQGAYTAVDGPYMNPWTTNGDLAGNSATLASTTSWQMHKNNANWGAGSVGNLRYHTQDAGLVMDYTTATGDIGIFWNMQNLKQAEYNTFNGLKSTFDADKKTYEDKHAEREKQKMEDGLGFTAKVVIPARPERPTKPYAYMGVTPDLSKFVGTSAVTWKLKASEALGNAALQVSNDFDATPAVTAAFANKLGYLIATNDTTATTVQSTGHVFGRLGQSDMNMPTVIKPYYWGNVTGVSAVLMLGIYPGDSSDTGLADAAKKIIIENKGAAWETDLYINKVPTAPTDASAQAIDLGASTLAISTAAAVLVASSLY